MNRRALVHAALIGFWTALACAAVEVWAMSAYDTDGMHDLRDTCVRNASAPSCGDTPQLHDRFTSFWLWVASSLLLFIGAPLRARCHRC